jgi:hypothetical protein
MPPYNPPRYLRQGDELPDDFGTRPGDTLTFGAGPYIRAFNAEEFRQFTDRPDGVVYGRGWHTTTPTRPASRAADRAIPATRPEPSRAYRLARTR